LKLLPVQQVGNPGLVVLIWLLYQTIVLPISGVGWHGISSEAFSLGSLKFKVNDLIRLELNVDSMKLAVYENDVFKGDTSYLCSHYVVMLLDNFIRIKYYDEGLYTLICL